MTDISDIIPVGQPVDQNKLYPGGPVVSCHIYRGHDEYACYNTSDENWCREKAIAEGCDGYSMKTSYCGE